MKYFLTSPDISYFSSEIERNGHWRPDLSPAEESDEDAQDLDLLSDL